MSLKMGRFAEEFVIIDKDNLSAVLDYFGYDSVKDFEEETGVSSLTLLGSLATRKVQEEHEVLPSQTPPADSNMEDWGVLFIYGYPPRVDTDYSLPGYLEPNGEGDVNATAQEWGAWYEAGEVAEPPPPKSWYQLSTSELKPEWEEFFRNDGMDEEMLESFKNLQKD